MSECAKCAANAAEIERLRRALAPFAKEARTIVAEDAKLTPAMRADDADLFDIVVTFGDLRRVPAEGGHDDR